MSKTLKKTKGNHKVVNLSNWLEPTDKEKILVNVARTRLGLLGWASAIPDPDTGGHDLWFAKPRSIEIYRCQSKAMSRYEFFSGKDARQYDQNVTFEWFLRSLHEPLFLFVFGLAEHKDKVCSKDFDTSDSNILKRDISDFCVGFVPGSLLRGWEYKLSAKKKARAVNLHFRYEPGGNRTIRLYSDKYLEVSGRTYFTENVTEYFDGPELGISKCLKSEPGGSFHGGNWQISKLQNSVPGKSKTYTWKVQCGCCNTAVLFAESDKDFVDGVVKTMTHEDEGV